MKISLFPSALLGLLLASNVWAGAFSVTPVRLYFEPRDRAVAITLVNESDNEIALQADINRWSQDDAGKDQMELTEDLIVSPPNMKLAPRSKQVIRVALLVPRDAHQQMTYRLVVRELPEAIATKEGEMQLPIALVLNMPVFITPVKAQRVIDCAATTVSDKPVEVICQNQGNASAQLRDIELKRDGKSLARLEGGIYLLPGAKKSIQLKTEEGARLVSGPAELSVLFDDRKQQHFVLSLP